MKNKIKKNKTIQSNRQKKKKKGERRACSIINPFPPLFSDSYSLKLWKQPKFLNCK